MTTKEFFRVYPYAVTSKHFAESLLNKEDDEINFIFSMFAFYIEQVISLSKKHSIAEIFSAFYDNESNMPIPEGAPISCRRGCAFCCHVEVSITKPEAEIILDYCKQHGIKIDYEYLLKQKHLTDQTHTKSDASKCVFLRSNNECNIYSVRPFACRNYTVISKPEFCDAVKYPKGRVVVCLDNEREVMRAALLSYLNKNTKGGIYQNSIARTLLDVKGK